MASMGRIYMGTAIRLAVFGVVLFESAIRAWTIWCHLVFQIKKYKTKIKSEHTFQFRKVCSFFRYAIQGWIASVDLNLIYRASKSATASLDISVFSMYHSVVLYLLLKGLYHNCPLHQRLCYRRSRKYGNC